MYVLVASIGVRADCSLYFQSRRRSCWLAIVPARAKRALAAMRVATIDVGTFSIQ